MLPSQESEKALRYSFLVKIGFACCSLLVILTPITLQKLHSNARLPRRLEEAVDSDTEILRELKAESDLDSEIRRKLEAVIESDAENLRELEDTIDSDSEILSNVFKIFTTIVEPDWLEPWKMKSQQQATGSGFPIEFQTQKYIVTNAHVAEFGSLRVRKPSSPARISASVVVITKDLDLAILAIDDDQFWEGVVPLELTFELPELASLTHAVGYPMGDDSMSVTRGVVSRVVVDNPRSGVVCQIQIDAALNLRWCRKYGVCCLRATY